VVGRSRFVAVFYHESQPLPDGTQKIGYILYDAIANRILAKGAMSCISPRSSLTWVAFSAELSLMAMDSDGMLSMLVSSGSEWEWMPMLDAQDLRKSEGDSFWPISVSDGYLNCVPLKGGVKYPNAVRRPVTSKLGFRLPFVRGPVQQTNALEELSVRASVALLQKKAMQEVVMEGEMDEEFENEYHALSAQVDKVTLKMFAATVDAGKLEKALDLVERLHLEKSIDIAMAMADNHRKLVDHIEGVKDRRFGGPEDSFAFTADNTIQKISPESNQGQRPKRTFDDDTTMLRSVRTRAGFA
jgi:chromosome transmission fidelity protein 4